MLVIACPGQGAQKSGFLKPWLELPGFAQTLGSLAEAAEIDLVAHGTTSDDDTIRDTAIAQPLLVASAIASAGELLDSPADVFAGHSVGEIGAAALAGVLSPEDAMRFVSTRGRAMAAAAAAQPTGMSAVVGGEQDAVLEAIERHGLTAANVNGGGQTVAAGTMDQLAALAQDAPERARVIPLSVAGAFHTSHMAPAAQELQALADTLAPADPATTLLTNADGTAVDSGARYLSLLVDQVSHPVRWDLCQETMLSLGVTGILELPPAGTLVGIARRAMRGVDTFALKTPDDLESARAFVAEHLAS